MPFTSTPTAFIWQYLNNTWSNLYPNWIGEYDSFPTVELGGFNGFTLDDPQLGLLDSGVLDGSVTYVDVTDYVISFGSNRGRSRDLERTNAGQLTIGFRNQAREFDPLNSSSPYNPYTVPRKPVRVSLDGIRVFTGIIDDWNYTYSMGGLSVASITASDAFSLFAREDNEGGSVPEQLSGARIDAILDQVAIAWPSLERDIEPGGTTLVADNLEGDALSYLQLVEQSEAGLIFMTKEGKFGFRERIFQPVTNALKFSDDGTGIAYDDIQIAYGTELLATKVTVTSPAGTATSENAQSTVKYGYTSKDVDTLLILGQLQGLADYIVAKYGVPEYRIERIRVNLKALNASDRARVLQLELGDQADLVFTPNGIGAPIALRNRVIGISQDTDPQSSYINLSFEELPFDFFILNDAVFGKLDDDAGVLGF